MMVYSHEMRSYLEPQNPEKNRVDKKHLSFKGFGLIENSLKFKSWQNLQNRSLEKEIAIRIHHV